MEDVQNNYRPEPQGEDNVPVQPQNDHRLQTTHGEIHLEYPQHPIPLKQHAPETKATGLPAVIASFEYAWGEAGLIRGTLPMLQINQKDGFDCPGCAWPDHDGKRSMFDFCENGIKAMAHESDKRRITAEFFATHSVEQLSQESDYWLEQQGRLTQPVLLREGATHYAPISWEAAFSLVADKLNSLSSPHEAAFYTSGKATNEAAFAYQLFVRHYGTNNLPDCSNMCHESSGAALTKMFGLGKGTAKLEDIENAELLIIVGQNPGTNHPRQLTALQQAKRNGAKIITINPLPETGLVSFMNPQEPMGLLGFATKLTDLFLQVNIGGDVALFKGLMKYLVEADDRQQGSAIDWNYIQAFSTGVEELLTDIRAADWSKIEKSSGISREQIEQAAELIRTHEKIVLCWCLGVTQHHNGTQTVQEMMNLLMLRGAIGKPGAGPCCVRGHSNVQGDRTMGVWERPSEEFLNRLAKAFGFEPPRDPGYDSQETVMAMDAGRIKVFISLGGNFLQALSDTRFTAAAMQKVELTVRIGTKLNRSDLVTGGQSLVLPCLGRTEIDARPATANRPVREQFTSTESSMGIVQSSRGRFAPAAPDLLGETEIICRLAYATLGTRTNVDWLAWGDDYDLIRDGVARSISGFENYNHDVRQPGGFYLPNPPRENKYLTPTGKATFTVNPLPESRLEPGQLTMTTVRSHDQFNTTIYGLNDRYRGFYYERRIIMMNAEDMHERGLKPQQKVDITSHFEGQQRIARSFVAVEYPIPRGCTATYFPEANVLIPIGSTDNISNCPSFKNTTITVAPAQGKSVDSPHL